MVIAVALIAALATALVAARGGTDGLGILLTAALAGGMAATVFRASHPGGLLLVAGLLVALGLWEVEQYRNRAR